MPGSVASETYCIMKILPLGAELFYADGWTDIKLVVSFRNSANAPKNVSRNYGLLYLNFRAS